MEIISKPKIAVLLAAYNGMEWIDEQINSILSQKDVDVTIFISVDFSDDNTYLHCKEIESKTLNVSVLEYGKRYGGAGRNFFRLIRDVDFSEFDYVSLADQDDIWLPEKLSFAVDKIRSRNLDAFSSDVTAFWDNGKEVNVKKSYPIKLYDYLFEAGGPGCTYVLKVSSLIEFRNFLIERFEEINDIKQHDWLIYAFFRSKGMSWYISDKALMMYRQHSNNDFGVNHGIKNYLKRLGAINNKWYRNEVKKICSILERDPAVFLRKANMIRNFWNLRRRPRDAFVLLLLNVVNIF